MAHHSKHTTGLWNGIGGTGPPFPVHSVYDSTLRGMGSADAFPLTISRQRRKHGKRVESLHMVYDVGFSRPLLARDKYKGVFMSRPAEGDTMCCTATFFQGAKRVSCTTVRRQKLLKTFVPGGIAAHHS